MARLETLADVAALNNAVPVPERGLSIGQYLIRRLQDYGIRDVFGIPGDYILTFYGLLEKSPLRVVGCTREDNAGFAADAYARAIRHAAEEAAAKKAAAKPAKKTKPASKRAKKE